MKFRLYTGFVLATLSAVLAIWVCRTPTPTPELGLRDNPQDVFTPEMPLQSVAWRPLQNRQEDRVAAKYVNIERVFPRLRFDRPVFLTGAGDDSGRLFVVEQAGVIRVFSMQEHAGDTDLSAQASKKVPTSEIFLDIRDRTSRQGNEEGLIGLAFHPDYKDNGEFFVHYSSSTNDMHGIVSRFRVSRDDPNRADASSEEVILQQQQPYRNHNGGSIHFGPDGFLYISFGDGGNANDPHDHAQNLNNWLGAVLRIDIDRQDEGRNYAVPPDNPFVGRIDAKPELWAVGLRNVWRMSFDRKTGQLWAGEVGQNKWEEISVIKRGGNYGWNRYEANADFKPETQLAVEPHQPPVAVYGREWGISVTGGYVYRGKQFPTLQGSYFYGDYASGNLWRLTPDGNGIYTSELARRTGRSIASFGEDDQGELYLVSFDGGIYRIVPSSEPENTFANWPAKLSGTGFYDSTAEGKVASHLIPYSINAPFWSDGADKSRYVVLPQGQKLQYRQTGTWEIPVGTTLIKNFQGQHLRGNRRLETRLIKRTQQGWEAATYVWDANGQDATLHPEGQQFELIQPTAGRRGWQIHSWHAPSASECASCHTDAAGFVLGLTTAQLNRPIDGADKNQIAHWNESGLVELPSDFDPENAPRFVDPHGETGSLETRARTWLDVNCAMCHRPDGPGNANIDLRFATDLEQTQMIDAAPAQGDLGIANARIVNRGQPDASLLLHRVETLGQGRMPNLGSNQIDTAGAILLRQWIERLSE